MCGLASAPGLAPGQALCRALGLAPGQALCRALGLAPGRALGLALSLALSAGATQAQFVEPVARVKVAKPKQVLAEGEDIRLTAADVGSAINEQLPWLQASRQQPRTVEQLAERMLELQLLAREACRRGVGNKAEVKRELDLVLARAYLARQLKSVRQRKPSQAHLKRYYKRNIKLFTRPARVLVLGIATEKLGNAQRYARWSKRASSKRFASLAKRRSLERRPYPPGSNGGWICKEGCSKVDEALVQGAFSMDKKGQVVIAQDAKERYWVLRYGGRKEEDIVPFEQVEPAIHGLIRREREEKATARLIKRLKRRYKVEQKPVGEALEVRHFDRKGRLIPPDGG